MPLPSPILRRYQILYEVGTGRTTTRKGLTELLGIKVQNLTRTLGAITDTLGVHFVYMANAADGIGRSESAQGEIRIYDWGILDEAKFYAWFRDNVETEDEG